MPRPTLRRAVEIRDGARLETWVWLRVAGEPVAIRIPLHDLAHAVAAGSRLRLLIGGGVLPLIDPSPNTGGPIAPATEAPLATQTVFHDRARSSRLILPVLASVWAAAA